MGSTCSCFLFLCNWNYITKYWVWRKYYNNKYKLENIVCARRQKLSWGKKAYIITIFNIFVYN